ncbi:outer membrane lipoprotein-sorting protein [bacterium]
MKKYFFISFLIFFMFLSTFLHALTGDEILKKMDDVRNYNTAVMNVEMKIIDKRGNQTTMSLISYEKKEGDKNLLRFTDPPRLQGTAILTVGDNIWYYNNRTNRVRLLSKSAKKGRMMGSSFSYEDMSLNYVKDFTAEILENKKKEYIIKMIPKDKDKTYKYLKARVSKKTFVAIKMEYYNKNDLVYKELTASDIKNIDDHIIPLRTEMTEIGSQKVTSFEIAEHKVEFDVVLKEELFSERYLKN